MIRRAALLILALAPRLMPAANESPSEISLPTENDALFQGGGPAFYQHIERDFQGEKSTPWEGGRYGFVRNPVPTAQGLVYTRFHEGIDIKPLRRDERGEPLDEIKAIADGKVVYTSNAAGFSNYGRYIVIQHDWNGSPYFSLYGHLSEIGVTVGEQVHRGQRIARMGYTGEGLNQARAHVHLEINLMLSRNFEAWYDHYIPREPNHHGIYNGINLTGIDVARFFLTREKEPELTVPRFLAEEETFYRVAVPDSPNFSLRKMYPWLVKNVVTGARSWEISFAGSGVPLKIEAHTQPVAAPTLTFAKKTAADAGYFTRGVLTGHADSVRLSESGVRQMHLLTFPE